MLARYEGYTSAPLMNKAAELVGSGCKRYSLCNRDGFTSDGNKLANDEKVTNETDLFLSANGRPNVVRRFCQRTVRKCWFY
jgi:hypothetical protein